jgi:hypothetical protein
MLLANLKLFAGASKCTAVCPFKFWILKSAAAVDRTSTAFYGIAQTA